MKNSVPCVIGYQLEESLQELENTAADVGVPLFRYGHEWQVERLPEGFAYKENNAVLKLPNPSLLGLHQYLNAGLAVACVQCLDDFDISDEHIRKGITNTIWKGRLEQIINSELIDALPDGYELWVDGAHNVAAFEMLERSIAHWQDKDLFLIMGVTKGRNIQELLKPLAGRIKHVCGVRVESEPSACSAAEIANSVAEMGISSSATDNLLDAVNEIAKISKNPANILICGSLYLSSDIHSYQVKAA
jgi:dihydrofolate synthase/folylpolyglutamate synthase